MKKFLALIAIVALTFVGIGCNGDSPTGGGGGGSTGGAAGTKPAE